MVKQNLVIVESPTKAKTIERYLGKNFKVVASKGHLRDLPKSKMGVDIEHNYEPHYISIRGKGDLIKSLKKEAAKADAVYLASDPDREGEAISWHLAHLLGLDLNAPIRVEFNEITKDAIKEAFKNPRKIDMDLVDAQQARRILDRLVGYTLSPILWKKVKKGLSAGRVQSIAVKLIIDRENEIKAFVPEEYWTLEGQFKKEKKAFTANYYGTTAEKANLEKEKTVKAVMLKEITEDGENFVMALIRGDLDVNSVKLKNAIGAKTELEMMAAEDCEKFGIVPGYAGSYEKKEGLKVVIDETVKYVRNFALGANKEEHHYINVNLEDIVYDMVSDIRNAREGDTAPDGKGTLKLAKGIEVGHIFKLGDKYSKALNAAVLDENGKQQIMKMGCYGIGISRVMAAAIEQNNDEFGIIWPKNIAPYLVDVIIANVKDEAQSALGEKIYEELLANGIEVVLDDRNERAGFKFKDADLIGFPLKIVAGKSAAEGKVEIKDRRTGESTEVKAEDVLQFVKDFMKD